MSIRQYMHVYMQLHKYSYLVFCSYSYQICYKPYAYYSVVVLTIHHGLDKQSIIKQFKCSTDGIFIAKKQFLSILDVSLHLHGNSTQNKGTLYKGRLHLPSQEMQKRMDTLADM